MALHNEGDWWMDKIMTSPSGRVITYPYNNLWVVLRHWDHRPNAFSLSYHIFWNLSTNISVYNSFITSHWCLTGRCWLCTTMVALVFWIACTGSGCTYCHIHCCEVFKMCERYHAQMKNEIMNMSRQAKIEFLSHILPVFSTTMPMSSTGVHTLSQHKPRSASK